MAGLNGQNGAGIMPMPAAPMPPPPAVPAVQAPARSAGYIPSVGSAPGWLYLDIPFWLGAWTIERMLLSPQIQMGLRAFKGPMAGAKFIPKGTNAIACAFALEQMTALWKHSNKILMNVEYGWAAGEVLYAFNARRQWVIDGYREIHPSDARPVIFNGRLVGVDIVAGGIANSSKNAEGVPTLPGPTGLWVTHQARFGRWFGRSRLLPAYQSWEVLTRPTNGLYCSRRLAAHKYAYRGRTASIKGYNSVYTEGPYVGMFPRDAMRQMLEAEAAGACSVYPLGDDGTDIIKFTDPRPMEQIPVLAEGITAEENMILLAIGVPPECITAAETGSGYAGRKVPFQILYSGINEVLKENAGQLWETVVKPLTAQNCGPSDTVIDVEELQPPEDPKEMTAEAKIAGEADKPGGGFGDELAKKSIGAMSLSQVQRDVYGGKISRPAGVASLVFNLGLSERAANELLPETVVINLEQPRGQPGNPGQFGPGGGSAAPDKPEPPKPGGGSGKAAAAPSKPASAPSGDSGVETGKAPSEGKLARLLGWLTGGHKGVSSASRAVAEKALTGVRTKIGEQYEKLERRYGSKWAKAIMGVGLAALPIPLPGSSFAAALPVIAAAELWRKIAGVSMGQDDDIPEPTPAEMARAFAAMLKAAGEGIEEPADLAFDESKHPRADDGKFGEGGGAAPDAKPETPATTTKPAKAVKAKMVPVAKAIREYAGKEARLLTKEFDEKSQRLTTGYGTNGIIEAAGKGGESLDDYTTKIGEAAGAFTNGFEGAAGGHARTAAKELAKRYGEHGKAAASDLAEAVRDVVMEIDAAADEWNSALQEYAVQAAANKDDPDPDGSFEQAVEDAAEALHEAADGAGAKVAELIRVRAMEAAEAYYAAEYGEEEEEDGDDLSLAFDESKHPRGQPENPGQFGTGGGGSSKTEDATEPAEKANAGRSKVASAPAKSKFSGQPVGKSEHVHAAKVESEIAKGIGGKVLSLEDGKYAPRDVQVGKNAIEIKSLLKGSKTSISVHEDALMRKVEYMKANPGQVYHTIVADERNTYGDGEFKGNFSGNRLYYKRGSGRYSLSKMQPVKSMAELKRLINADAAELPENARGELPPPPPLKELKAAAEKAHASRLAKDRARKARLKSEREAARS